MSLRATLDEEDRFIEAVRRGEDALERGEYLTHEAVGERLRRARRATLRERKCHEDEAPGAGR